MDYLIEFDFEGPGFVAVPNRVFDDHRLSMEAVAVLGYLARLAGKRSGVVRVSAIRKRYRCGKDRWQRIARELRAVGALRDEYARTADGREIVRCLKFGWPPETCEPENPAHRAENPAHVSRKTRLLKEEEESACRKAALQQSGAARAASNRLRKMASSSRPEGSRDPAGEKERAPWQVQRSLGLPYRDPVTDEWVTPSPSSLEPRGTGAVPARLRS